MIFQASLHDASLPLIEPGAEAPGYSRFFSETPTPVSARPTDNNKDETHVFISPRPFADITHSPLFARLLASVWPFWHLFPAATTSWPAGGRQLPRSDADARLRARRQSSFHRSGSLRSISLGMRRSV